MTTEQTKMNGLTQWKYLMSLDVEAIGLHGEGWAVGFVVYDAAHFVLSTVMPTPVEMTLIFCKPERARGTLEDHEWVKANCKISGVKSEHTQSANPSFRISEVSHPAGVRSDFWNRYRGWQKKANNKLATIGDTVWPVETNFFSACIEDKSPLETWTGPYPLLDLRTIVQVFDNRSDARLPSELPEHDPVNDALYSARRLWEAMKVVRTKV